MGFFILSYLSMIRKRIYTFVLLTTALFLLTCSEAPYIELSASRIILAELFTQTD
jgi:hypothetical protein